MAINELDNKEGKEEVVLVPNDENQDVEESPSLSWIQEMIHYLQTGEFPQGLNNAK